MIRHVTHDPTRDTEHHKQGVSSTGGFHPALEHPKINAVTAVPIGIATVYALT
jgi:hypothetical protein